MKKCKGLNKAKGVGCGIEKHIHKFGLCSSCFGDWLYNTDEGKLFFDSTKLKASKFVAFSQKKEANKIKKETRFELKTYPQRVNEARAVFQRWIRNRDKDECCISCLTPFADEWHGGHYKKAEKYSQLIFNEDNVNKQCKQCNYFLGGNEANYRQNLIKKIGESAVLELDSATPDKMHKYSNEELKNIIKEYKNKLEI